MENVYLSFPSKEVQFAYPFSLFFLNCCARTCMSRYMTEVHNYQSTSHYRGLSDHVLSSHVVHLAHRKKLYLSCCTWRASFLMMIFPVHHPTVVTPSLAARCQAELITGLQIRLKTVSCRGKKITSTQISSRYTEPMRLDRFPLEAFLLHGSLWK